MHDIKLVKSEIIVRATEELKKSVKADLSKMDENTQNELEKFVSLLKGAESPKPVEAQND